MCAFTKSSNTVQFFVNAGESDSTPIVVIRELNCSPGKKNGIRKSLELPLIPVSVSFPQFYLSIFFGEEVLSCSFKFFNTCIFL